MTILERKKPNPRARLVRLRPSRHLLMIVLAMHGVAALATVFANLNIWLQQLLIVGLAVHAGFYAHRWRKTPSYRLQKIQNHWTLVNDNNAEEQCMILYCYYWSRYIIVLAIEKPNKSRAYFSVLPDSCDSDAYHWFKVLSRFEL